MDRKTVLAMVLIGAMWIGYFTFFQPKITKDAKQSKKIETTTTETEKKVKPAVVSKIVVAKNNTKLDEKIIENETFKVTLTNKGAAIKSVIYKKKNIDLVAKEGFSKTKKVLDFPIHFSKNDFQKGNPALEKSNWKVDSVLGNQISFSTVTKISGNNVKLSKIFTFPTKGHSFDVSYKIANMGRNDLSISSDGVMFSTSDMVGPNLDYENTLNKQITPVYSFNDDFETGSKGGSKILGMFGSDSIPFTSVQGQAEYVGISGRYFLLLMIPKDKSKVNAVVYDGRKNTGFRTGIQSDIKIVKSGETITRDFTIYLGEKDEKKLVGVNPILKKAEDVNVLIKPIRDFVTWFLHILNDQIGNMGWALVIFSILSKIIFMPLTNKSTESMKKMGQLSPKLKELKAKYKDKPDVLQKETMALYKENGVNPMGGCLPMILQMPFFIALYSALNNSFDLWNAPFIFWIQDLSMPDVLAQNVFNLGYDLHLLPILMTITTILQQKLTAVDTGSAQQQQMMMYMMPLVMLFIFWSMPSGLVLYWTLQNAFQVVNQLWVNSRQSKKEA